jgi:hypothetical protein
MCNANMSIVGGTGGMPLEPIEDYIFSSVFIIAYFNDAILASISMITSSLRLPQS